MDTHSALQEEVEWAFDTSNTANPDEIPKRKGVAQLSTVRDVLLSRLAGSAGMQIVYEHIRQCIFYLWWAMAYIYLVFVQQPLTFFAITITDYLWMRWPWMDIRDRIAATLQATVRRINPSVAEYFFTKAAFGHYVGTDRALRPGERKQIPLHSVSLNGCAWMLPYHIGVCEVLKKERIVDENTVWLGSSGGALIAAAAALDLDLDFQLNFCANVGMESNQQHALGPVGKMSHYIGPHVRRSLPKDCHLKASGRLLVSVTETPHKGHLWGNTLFGNFNSRQHLYNTLMASTYIPFYYEIPVRPGRGAFHWDGGFSNNQPVILDEDTGRILSTTVSPTARKADISPRRQETCNIEHLLPGDRQSALAVYARGKADANEYVKWLRSSHMTPGATKLATKSE